MHCSACSTAIQKALQGMPGVYSADVNLLTESASIAYDGKLTSVDKLVSEIEDCGFEAKVALSRCIQPDFSSRSRCTCRVHSARTDILQRISVLKSSVGVQVPEQSAGAASVVIDIEGMHCAACSSAIERALASEPGIHKVGVNLLQHSAQVTFDPSVTSPAAIAASIEACGFVAKPNAATSHSSTQSITVEVTGMHCAACSSAVENALKETKGVVAAEVNLLTHSAKVSYTPDATGPRDILNVIEDCGFDAALSADPSAGASAFAANNRAVQDATSALIAALIFSVPTFLIGNASMLFPSARMVLRSPLLGFPAGGLVQWILATPVQFVVGWRFHVGAVASLRRRSANMDVLVSLGTFAAYLYAAGSLLHAHFARRPVTGACRKCLLHSRCRRVHCAALPRPAPRSTCMPRAALRSVWEAMEGRAPPRAEQCQ
jgi:P-type Cu+ transporter